MFTCGRLGCCHGHCSLCGHLQDAVTVIVHSVAVCRTLLQLFTLWPFAGHCYNCSLCGRLQDAVTIVHSVVVCRMLLPSLCTLWSFAGCCYHHCALCGRLQDAVTITVHPVAVCRMLLPSLCTLWSFAGCCYDRLLCGCLQDFSVPEPQHDCYPSWQPTHSSLRHQRCTHRPSASQQQTGLSTQLSFLTFVSHTDHLRQQNMSAPGKQTQQWSGPHQDQIFFSLLLPFFSSNSGSVKLHVL